MFLPNLGMLISKILVPLDESGRFSSYDVIKVKTRGKKVKLLNMIKGWQVTPLLKGIEEYYMN